MSRHGSIITGTIPMVASSFPRLRGKVVGRPHCGRVATRLTNSDPAHTRRKESSIMMMLMALLTSLQARLEERERGQGMVEYGLIIAAVAIAVIVALFALGPKIGSMFSSTAASLK